MHSIPCPQSSTGPWGTSTFCWHHMPGTEELVLMVGGKSMCRLELQSLNDTRVLECLRQVTGRGYCDEIPGALVRALVDLGHIGTSAAA